MADAAADTRERPQQTAAQRQKEQLDKFMSSLVGRTEQLNTLLSDSGVDPAFFLEVCRRALTRTPDLMACTAGSLMQSFINAATDGLPPDGRMGAIVSYKLKDGTKVAQWIPMVQGLLELAHRSGLFLSIEARVVYDGDFFDYELGDNPYIKHKPSAAAVANRKISQAYAVAKTTNGGIYREVMEQADVEKIRAVSRASNGPNKDWPEEMARKAPLRRMWKYLPKSNAMARLIEHDQEADLDIPAPEPKRLQAGFQAIEGGDVDPAEWAASFNRAVSDFEAADIDQALAEPINVRRLEVLKAKESGLHDALMKSIEDRRAELAKAAKGDPRG